MPWVGLRCVIVVFPDHTHLLFVLAKTTDPDEMSHYAYFALIFAFVILFNPQKVRLVPLNMFKTL